MKPLLINTVITAWSAYRTARREERRRLREYRAWGKSRDLSLISNRTGRDEYVLNQAQFERLNRIIHGGDE